MKRSVSIRGMALVLAATLCMLAFQGHSATRQDIYKILDGLEDNWPEAGLEAWINDNPEDPTVVLGDPVTYSFRAGASGYVSMVHVDSHGTSTLLFPRKQSYEQAPISDTYPRSGALEQSSPLGKETLYVVLTQQPVDPVTLGAAPDEDFVRSEDSLDLAKRYAAAVTDLARTSQVALTRFHYFVEAKPGTTEYTTRGIKRVLLGDQQAAQSAPSQGAATKALRRNWPDRIAFEFDSDELTPQGRVQLDVWGEVLADKRIEHSVILVGHTDDVGGEQYNLELSRKRALSARNYIVENFGVDPARLEIQWRGEAEPLVPNVDDDSRTKNRRVDFVFVRE
jgi:outer membrane protein OmpA-like peptidoglycan-associated protein